jgi:hypothetical protein
MGNMTEAEETTVPAKTEDTPEEENGRRDKAEEVEEANAAEEAANEVDATTEAEAAGGTEESEATKEEEEEVADETEATPEEGADGTERKRNTRKRQNDPPMLESKRARKSAETFAPAFFSKKGTQDKVNIIEGRGSRLGSILNVRKSIESFSNTAEDIHMAHRLLFTIRGKPGKDDFKYRKDQLLAFSGFLTPLVEGEDQNYRAKIDDQAEVRHWM